MHSYRCYFLKFLIRSIQIYFRILDRLRFGIGIALLLIAVVMYFVIEDIKDDKRGILFATSLSEIVQFCNSGWGDIFNVGFQCMKAQVFYYSPWISGFFAVIFLVKAGPYRGYHGYGGAGSHNRRFRLRQKTKKKLIIIISVSVAIAFGIFVYSNYEVTIGNQKLDDIIPPESFEKTLEEISKSIPVKIEERP